MVSDTHGNREYLRKAAERLVKKKAVAIVHLGDDYDDVTVLSELEIEVLQVPGVFSKYYQDPNIPNRQIHEFNGINVLVSHTVESHRNDLPSDMKPEEIVEKKRAQVVLFGHTHIPLLEEKQGILYMNPGHLKEKDKRGSRPSYGIVDFEEGKVTARTIDFVTGQEIDALSIVL